MNGHEIRALRKEMGLTQAQFCKLLGATLASISRWENGVVKPSRLYIKEMENLREEHGRKDVKPTDL